jgi:hypothetical protein
MRNLMLRRSFCLADRAVDYCLDHPEDCGMEYVTLSVKLMGDCRDVASVLGITLASCDGWTPE